MCCQQRGKTRGRGGEDACAILLANDVWETDLMEVMAATSRLENIVREKLAGESQVMVGKKLRKER